MSNRLYLNVDKKFERIELRVGTPFVHGEGGEYPIYKGRYDVVPKFTKQELETKDTILKKNVEVEEIPVQKAENLGGGYTVTIGG